MPIVRRTAPRSAVPKPSYPIGSAAGNLQLLGYHPAAIDRQVSGAAVKGAGTSHYASGRDPRLHTIHTAASAQQLRLLV